MSTPRPAIILTSVFALACAPAADSGDTADTGDTGDTGAVEHRAISNEPSTVKPQLRRGPKLPRRPSLGAVAPPAPVVNSPDKPVSPSNDLQDLFERLTEDSNEQGEQADHPYQGSRTVESAEDLAELHGFTRIQGDLLIRETELTDLKPLSELRVVEGSLIIDHNSELESLAGLEELRSVGVEMAVINNDALRDISALARLEEIGLERRWCGFGDAPTLALFHNDLTSLTGLEGLRTINGPVNLRDNGTLDPGLQAAVTTQLPSRTCRVDGEEEPCAQGLNHRTLPDPPREFIVEHIDWSEDDDDGFEYWVD
jgi:hypothetical protein